MGVTAPLSVVSPASHARVEPTFEPRQTTSKIQLPISRDRAPAQIPPVRGGSESSGNLRNRANAWWAGRTPVGHHSPGQLASSALSALPSNTYGLRARVRLFRINGSAVALGRLRRCDLALEVGATVQSIRAWRRDTDHIEKAFVFGGMPARSGATSALLVQSAWTGVDDILSGPDNLFVANASKAQPRRLAEKLGERYEIAQMDIKKWTVGSPIQGALDAVELIRGKWSFEADRMSRTLTNRGGE